MNDLSPAHHESEHSLGAFVYGLTMSHVSIRPTEDSLGRCRILDGHKTTDHHGAVVMIAGHVAERMALGRDPRPNWFLEDDHDVDSARVFIERAWGDTVERQQEGRALAQLQARSLLTVHWDAVQEIAQRLERYTGIVGEEVVAICKRHKVRRAGELSKEEAMAKMTPAGRKRLLGVLAADGKGRIEKAINR